MRFLSISSHSFSFHSTSLIYNHSIAVGADSPADIDASRVMRRLSVRDSVSYADLYPAVVTGSLITGSAPRALQTAWDLAGVTMRVPHAAQDVKLKRQFTAFA